MHLFSWRDLQSRVLPILLLNLSTKNVCGVAKRWERPDRLDLAALEVHIVGGKGQKGSSEADLTGSEYLSGAHSDWALRRRASAAQAFRYLRMNEPRQGKTVRFQDIMQCSHFAK